MFGSIAGVGSGGLGSVFNLSTDQSIEVSSLQDANNAVNDAVKNNHALSDGGAGLFSSLANANANTNNVNNRNSVQSRTDAGYTLGI